ncbi:MAG TPA: ankyrin repeat domain-containing protein [Clostridia bacterium]|nr:ankyrin repeat domain-containing protein [Clostridia bacterium]
MKTRSVIIAVILTGMPLVILSGCATSHVSQPIHAVAKGGDIETVKNLLRHGTRPNTRDGQGWTLLHHAAYNGKPEVARVLLDVGAKTHLKDRQGFTPLHWAVYESAGNPGSAETAKLLVARGADVNARDMEGSTPLFWTMWQGDSKMVLFLLDHGADPNLTGKEGLTVLASAQKHEMHEMAALISGHMNRSGHHPAY